MQSSDKRNRAPAKAKGRTAGGLSPGQKKQVRDIVVGKLNDHVEPKAAILDSSGVSILTTATITDLSTIGQGVTRDDRVGDRLQLIKLTWRNKIIASTGGLLASADAYDTVRVILFRWWDDSAVNPPLLGNILKQGAGGTDYTVASLNVDDKEQYTILMDETVVVYNTTVYNGTALTVEPGFGHVAIQNRTLPLRGDKHIYYNNNANTGVGHVYVLYVSDSAFTPHPTMAYALLLEYQDA